MKGAALGPGGAFGTPGGSAGGGGLAQAASYLALGAGSNGELKQTPDGRVWAYRDIVSRWLPAEISPTALLHALDVSADPLGQGWTEDGGINVTTAPGLMTVSDANGANYLRYRYINANISDAISTAYMIRMRVTASGGAQFGFYTGMRFTDRVVVFDLAGNLGQQSCEHILGNFSSHMKAAAGEGPDNTLEQVWLMTRDASSKMIKMDCLTTPGWAPSAPHSVLADNVSWFNSPNQLMFGVGTPATATVEVSDLRVFNY